MPPKIRLITIAICIFIVVYVFELVRRRHLNEEYSMGWLITGLLMLLMASWITLLSKISTLVGSATVTSTLFFLGLLFLIVICLHFSIRISNLTNQVRKLSQSLSILNHEVDLVDKKTRQIEEKEQDINPQIITKKIDTPSNKSVIVINENFKNN